MKTEIIEVVHESLPYGKILTMCKTNKNVCVGSCYCQQCSYNVKTNFNTLPVNKYRVIVDSVECANIIP